MPGGSGGQVEGRRGSWLQLLRGRLGRTRERFRQGAGRLVPGTRKLDAETLRGVETGLLLADVGVAASGRVLDGLRARLRRGGDQAVDLQSALLEELRALLEPVEQPLRWQSQEAGSGPFLVFLMGVNGAGKTTLAGKLAAHFRAHGARVMLAAADTFRAAAIDQLQCWGARAEVPVVARLPGSDSAAVVFDALQAARAREIDLLIVDTAGRLHVRRDLLEELRKICRVPGRFQPPPPVERLMVLDAAIGQNSLQQVRGFHEAVGLDGLAVNKLDGTARGGVLLALAEEFGLPVRFLGAGEEISDLEVFRARDFAAALVGSVECSGSLTSASAIPAE